MLVIGHDHHVLGEAVGYREGLGERVDQEVPELERRADDDVAVVELPRDETPAVPPVEHAAATLLADALELSGEAAEVGELHAGIVALASPHVADDVVIRPEREEDFPAIAEVVRAAFVDHPDEVADFVARIRASEQYVPELALVAEDSSGVIAHVMLSFVGVEGGARPQILCLTPMSVRPDRQRVGVGSRLIRDALGRAEETGEPAVVLEGHPDYYPRFGFERASALGFAPHRPILDEAFMVKRLPGYTPEIAGRIAYPASYAALGYEV